MNRSVPTVYSVDCMNSTVTDGSVAGLGSLKKESFVGDLNYVESEGLLGNVFVDFSECVRYAAC